MPLVAVKLVTVIAQQDEHSHMDMAAEAMLNFQGCKSASLSVFLAALVSMA